MSFTFTWPRFSPQFHTDAIQMLNTALNKGNKPPVIADKIEVVELEMGTQPPELEIRDIGDLTMDQFRGIFRLTYAGDAHIVLKTKVQANPLNHKQPDIHLMSGSRGMLAAKHPLVVPMLLRLSHFKLNSYVVLVVSKQKGITLVFKTDPLQSVDINSTFDSIAVIQMFIQREIEGQLRQMFREDLPSIIHRLSQQWVKAGVERTPSMDHPQRPSMPPRRQTEMSPPPSHRPGMHSGPRSTSGVSHASTGRRTSASSSFATAKSSPATPAASTDHFTSFPDLENYDPTYGLRPEGLPAKSVFRGFSNLFSANKGLADLAEEGSSHAGDNEEEDYDNATQYDVVDWEDTVPDFSVPDVHRHSMSDAGDDPTEYETMPAIGGGTITRPRVYHSQSMMGASTPARTPSLRSGMTSPLRPGASSLPMSPRGGPFMSRNPSLLHNSYFPDTLESESNTRRSSSDSMYSASTPHRPVGKSQLYHSSSSPTYRYPSTRPQSPDSQPSRSSSGSVQTPDSSEILPHQLRSFLRDQESSHHHHHPIDDEDPGGIYMKVPTQRRPSISVASTSSHFERDPFSERDAFNPSSSPPTHHHRLSADPPNIVLRPSLNNSIHQLSTLSHSNHTLSPYTRSLEHFTVRSVPPRGSAVTVAAERQPVKARRKRIHRLGGGGGAAAGKPAAVVSPPPPLRYALPPHSEFDMSDMDKYFRSHDSLGTSLL